MDSRLSVMVVPVLLCAACHGEPSGRKVDAGAGGQPPAAPAAASAVGLDGGSPGDDRARPEGDLGGAEPQLTHPEFPLPPPGQMVKIPAGSFLRGSRPEDPLRDHAAENDLVRTELNEYEIDALPYPNDPSQPFLTDVDRAAADAACQSHGKRLCTELEWERACRGLEPDRRYPTGYRYDPAAYPDAEPWQPASPDGVFAMGRLLEWTQSRWGDEPDQVSRVAIRGFSSGTGEAPERGRRCARRLHRVPEAREPELGFRCCRGAVNPAVNVIEGPRPPFSVYTNIKPDKFARVIRSIPELKPLFDNPRMFSDADLRSVLARREKNRAELSTRGWEFSWKPVRWIPRQGMELWVVAGRSDRHAFVTALHEVEDNEKYVHASSLILWNQPLPLALGWKKGHRDQLFWAPCWGCRDGGTVEVDDARGEVIITHKW